ncbi:hypothetical protein BX070DRAFT_255547 [Coemansia spiralis]|nr:hypothetical protein BX070DRAFT_255547 [Coemansia spiralis]
MTVEDLSEQRSLVQSAILNLKHNDDAQVGRDIAQRVETTHTQRQQDLDKTQESLQQLSRRLQAARTRVDTSKAQREAKSHTETMNELQQEKKTVEDSIVENEQTQASLTSDIARLESEIDELDENVEREMVPDENVLRLQILRGLGVEPLVGEQTSAIDAARVWSKSSACVVKMDESVPAHQIATQLWDLCSS